MNDLQPYVCIFPDCSEAGKTYESQRDFLLHALNVHRKRDYYQLGKCQPVFPDICIFCEEVLSKAAGRKYAQHLGRHMNEIAFMVVTKLYEDWDFYSDASSVNQEVIHKSRNTTASYDAKGDEDTAYQNRRM